jgi:hypothetical protein
MCASTLAGEVAKIGNLLPLSSRDMNFFHKMTVEGGFSWLIGNGR